MTQLNCTSLIRAQYELVTGALTPLEAADALIFTRETISNVANRHGLHATFAPQVFDGTCKIYSALIHFFT